MKLPPHPAAITAFRDAVAAGAPFAPRDVKLKLVWTCNLRCGMCPHWRTPGERPLATDEVARILGELAGAGAPRVHRSGGEPTLRPDLVAIVAHAAGLGLRVTMTTNATRITKALAKDLVAAGLRKVNVSIDAPDAPTHDALRGRPGAHAAALRGLAQLARRLPPARIRLNTVVAQPNHARLAELPDFAAAHGAGRLNLLPVDPRYDEVPGLDADDIRAYNAEVGPAIAARGLALGLLDARAEAFPFGEGDVAIAASARGEYAHGYYADHRCYAPWLHALIDHVGRVRVCCMLTTGPVLGDLRQAPFAEIWAGAAYAALRAAPRGCFASCARCDHFLGANQALERLVAGV